MKKSIWRALALTGAMLPLLAAGAASNATVKPGVDMKISIDFKARSGQTIKPLHGFNNSRFAFEIPMPELKELREAGIPYVRLHDTGGYMGGNRFVDIPNVFPDFNADENDPASYSFEMTDYYVKQLKMSGTEIYYRLGVTIENQWWIKKYRIDPPADMEKWARVCEHVVRHYNEGWANGFHYNIKYWEIWNEPENPAMWSGSKEQYFELYKVTSRHLHQCFPDIKIGGFGSCGFYANNTKKDNEFYQGCLVWFTDFLDFVKAEKLPLDFFSWHRYYVDPEELRSDCTYVRTELDKRGLTATESHFNEWNYVDTNSPTPWDDMKEAIGASAIAASMILMQHIDIDVACYYAASAGGSYSGLYYSPNQTVTPTYYSFKAFNRLYVLRNEVPVQTEGSGVYVLAAGNDTGSAMLAANNGKEPKAVVFELQNAAGTWTAYLTDETQTFKVIAFDPAKPFVMPGHSVLLIEAGSETLQKSDTKAGQGDFAGVSDKDKDKKAK